MNKCCFITGATGFIGKRLTKQLAESGYKVKCLTRANSKREALLKFGVDFIDGDLTSLDALRRGAENCDSVFHLAGLTRESRRGDFQVVNCEGTRNVARACAEVGVGRLVHVSSLAAAGAAIKESNVTRGEEEYAPYRLRKETDLSKPISPYGKSKRDAENALLDYVDKTSTVVLRPPYVFGEGDMLSLELYKMAKRKGIFVNPGYIDRFYSFVYVGDLVNALVALSEGGERLAQTSFAPIGSNQCLGEGVYFPTCPKAIKFSKFGALIGRAYGRERVKVIKVPPLGVIGAGVYGEIVKTLRHKPAALDWNKAVEAVCGPWICSGDKLIGSGVIIDPDLEEKIARAARWYEKEGLL